MKKSNIAREKIKNKTAAAVFFMLLIFCGAIWALSGKPVPILMYHDVCADPADANAICVSAEKLEADIVWLRDHGYTTILPRDLVSGGELPEKPVILSFDDGYRSNYELLFPLLQKYGAKAEISVIVSNIDNGYAHFMSWDQLREMRDSGLAEIGSHTYDLHNPASGGAIDPDGPNGIMRLKGESRADFEQRVGTDLRKSCSRIEEALGQKVVTFAYPYGASDRYSRRLVRELFGVSFSTKSGMAGTRRTQHLPRFAVNDETNLDELL